LLLQDNKYVDFSEEKYSINNITDNSPIAFSIRCIKENDDIIKKYTSNIVVQSAGSFEKRQYLFTDIFHCSDHSKKVLNFVSKFKLAQI
jgi:hypothetical protein